MRRAAPSGGVVVWSGPTAVGGPASLDLGCSLDSLGVARLASALATSSLNRSSTGTAGPFKTVSAAETGTRLGGRQLSLSQTMILKTFSSIFFPPGAASGLTTALTSQVAPRG